MHEPSPVIGLIVFVVLGCVALAGYRLGIGRRRAQPHEQPPAVVAAGDDGAVEELRRQLEILSSSTLGVAERVQRLAGEVAEVRDNVQEVSTTAAAGDYTPAIRMAASGCKVDELVDHFGLSRGEAELLRKLHGDAASRRSTHH